MGIDRNGLKTLLWAKQQGVDFSRAAMIGRQELHLSRRVLSRVFKEFGIPLDPMEAERLMTGDGGYAEGLFKKLGAAEVSSFDSSAYEDATHVHDMNREIPDTFKNRYSLVLDGGSLEHVFNFPVALKNCLDMVRVGGHFLSITQTNNCSGHGFYQFSPELYFSALDGRNGFQLLDVVVVENRPGASWYRVTNPVSLNRRITFTNAIPVYLMVLARKEAEESIFAQAPQQSDYQYLWQRRLSGIPPDSRPELVRKIRRKLRPVKRRILLPLRRRVIRTMNRFRNPFRPPAFQRIDPRSLYREPTEKVH